MKKVLLLSFLATGLLFSCSEEKKEEVKEETKVEAEAKKVEEATSSAIHDIHENADHLKEDVEEIKNELDAFANELENLNQ